MTHQHTTHPSTHPHTHAHTDTHNHTTVCLPIFSSFCTFPSALQFTPLLKPPLLCCASPFTLHLCNWSFKWKKPQIGGLKVIERERRESEGEGEWERERGLESHGNMADSLQGLSLRTKASGRGLLCSLCYPGYKLAACACLQSLWVCNVSIC